MKPKKSYGQHFLRVESISEKIADSLLSNVKEVAEIGPGQGMLTKYLLEKDYKLIAIEADKDMVGYLANHYPRLKVVSEDFLKVKLEEYFNNEFAVIGNFPYNISSQIVFKIIEYKEQIPEMVGMFQKEMAERIVAPPGSKTYGVISVLTQAYYEGEYLFTVNREAFNPPPKVTSAVIRLTRKKNLDLGCDEKLFRRIVKTSFQQRRKMLRNTLKPFTQNKELLQDEFFQQRPERLSVVDFVRIANLLE